MAWVAIPSAVSGAVATSAYVNTYLKGDLDALHSVLDGTAQAFGSTLYPTSDARFALKAQYGTLGGATIDFDTGDYLLFEANVNEYRFLVGGATKLVIDGNGKLTGAGFYDSGDVTVTGGSGVTLSHGLGGRPRSVTGYQHSSGPGAESASTNVTALGPAIESGYAASKLFVAYANNTQIRIENTDPSAYNCRVYARY